MTTVEQLLASLTEDDKTFVIDNDLRTINIPDSINNLGVESDDDVLTVYFQMPSVYCGIDLSQFNIRINYLNAAKEGDYHDVDDAKLQSDGTIRFSWTVGRHAASVVGTVEFNVCLKKTDPSGKVIKEFNTTTATLPILKGLEISEQVISEYNDILEQWRAKLFGIGDTEEAKILAVSQEQQQVISEQSATVLSDIELKGSETLKTIPDTYTEVYNMAEEALRTKADAIVLEAEGTAISVDDSSDDHLQNLKLYGRTTQAKTTGAQLAYIPDVESFENNGITWSSNGGVVTAKGSAPIHSYTPSHIHADLKGLVGTFYLSGNGKYIKVAVQCTRDGVTNYINAPQVFTLDGTETRVELYCQITTYNVDIDDTVYPMVNVGNTALPWEPYTGGKPSPNPDYPQDLVSVENPTVDICGKNLIAVTAETGDTSVGCAITVNDDGSVTINGTATKEGSIPLNKKVELPVGQYILSGEKVTAFLRTSAAKHISTHFSGSTITIDDPTAHLFICVYANNGQVFDNFRTYPMLRAVSVNDSIHELYKPVQSLTINRTLRGIPVTSGGNYTDENGQQWICDEIDFDKGVHIQRVGRLLLNGSESWNEYNYGTQYYGYHIWDALDEQHSRTDGLCNQFNTVGGGEDKCVWVGVANKNIYAISKEWYDKGLDAWKSHLNENPLEVIYKRITPIETPLTSEEILAYKALKTNRTNTTVLNDQNTRMAIAYSADTLKFLRDNQPKPTEAQVETAIATYLDEKGIQVPSDDYINELINAYLRNTAPIAKIGVVTLTASAWEGSDNLYSQIVSIDGVTKNSQVDLTPDVEQLAIFHDKDLTFVTENDGGIVTVYAIGQKPTNDYTIQVTITEVYV